MWKTTVEEWHFKYETVKVQLFEIQYNNHKNNIDFKLLLDHAHQNFLLAVKVLELHFDFSITWKVGKKAA